MRKTAIRVRRESDISHYNVGVKAGERIREDINKIPPRRLVVRAVTPVFREGGGESDRRPLAGWRRKGVYISDRS